MSRKLLFLGALLAVALPQSVIAQPAHPWEAASALLKATEADVKGAGIAGIQSHAPAIQAALIDGQALPKEGVIEGNVRYVLTDGGASTLGPLLQGAIKKEPGVTETVAIRSPYPSLAFYLGAYYDEIGRFDEGLKALDAGLVLDSWKGDVFGNTQPVLVAERGAALTGLKRWPEVLANYEDGLKIQDLPDHFKAVMHRGRGFALVELGKLDEGETAYKESLKFEPGNARAQNELQYIARLRAGGARAPTAIGLSAPK